MADNAQFWHSLLDWSLRHSVSNYLLTTIHGPRVSSPQTVNYELPLSPVHRSLTSHGSVCLDHTR